MPEHVAPLTIAQMDELEQNITALLDEMAIDSPVIGGIERGEAGERRWYVRLLGEEKEFFSVWFTLHQRTLHYETYFMPAPAEQRAEVFDYLMRRGAKLYGAAFVIGSEDAVYLAGQLDNRHIDAVELDRVIGSLYMTTESCFRPAMRLGFASKFNG